MGKIEGMGDFAILFATLQSDIDHLLPYQPSETPGNVCYPDPVRLAASERRSLVRSVFAFVEGNSYFLRGILLASYPDKLSPEIQLALSEQQIELTGSGLVRRKALRASMLDMLRLTIKTFGAVLPSLTVQASGAEFESLVRSTKVRDRLMHPKSVSALTVTDAEIRDVMSAFSWFSLSMREIMRASNAYVADKLLQEFGLELSLSLDPVDVQIKCTRGP